MQRRNNIFELVTIAPIQSNPNLVDTARLRMDNLDWNEATEGIRIRLRGACPLLPPVKCVNMNNEVSRPNYS